MQLENFITATLYRLGALAVTGRSAMFIFDVACRCFLFSIIFVSLSPLAFAESGPSLGESVAPEEIVKWDISIAPDGLN